MDDSLTTSLKNLWGKPIGALPTFADLGRLAKRIDVSTTDEVPVAPKPNADLQTSSDAGDKADELPNAWYLGRALQTVASKLETPASYPKVLDGIKAFKEAAGTQPDLETYIKDLFSTLEENSPTLKLFKLVNQAALAAAITPLKLSASSRSTSLKPEVLITKDVRTSDGWRIAIDIGTSEICLSHARREQSMVFLRF
jgi:hypothetical protein